MEKEEVEKNKRLVAVIRQIAKEIAYEVLEDHIQEKHATKNTFLNELESY